MAGLIRSTALSVSIVLLIVTGFSKPESPGEAVEKTYSTIHQGDVDTVWQRMSQADRTKFMSALGITAEQEAKQVLQEEFAKQTHHRVAIGKVQRDGDSATVVVTMFRDPEDANGETTTIKLSKEGGKWVLDDNSRRREG